MTDSSFAPFDVLLEDGPLLAVNKPAGLLTLGAGPGIPTLERLVKAWIKARFDKPGNVYLGIPHRLDRPVSGVMVFARNSKTAARLAEQFRDRQVRKIYWALTALPPEPAEGELVDWLLKVPGEARVDVVETGTPGAREARLTYRTLERGHFSSGISSDNERPLPEQLSNTLPDAPSPTLLEIELHTGRMHQIRVQLARRGWHVLGDVQYGAAAPLASAASLAPRESPIALHARSLTLLHPIRYEPLTITAPLPALWGLLGFPPG